MTPGSMLAGIAPPTRLVGAPAPTREPERPPTPDKGSVAPPPKQPFSTWLRETQARSAGREAAAAKPHDDLERAAGATTRADAGDPDGANADATGSTPVTTAARRSIAPKPRALIPGRSEGPTAKAADTDAGAATRSAETARTDAESHAATARTTGIAADPAALLDETATAALAADRRGSFRRDIDDGSKGGRASAVSTGDDAGAAALPTAAASASALVGAADFDRRAATANLAAGDRGLVVAAREESSAGTGDTDLQSARGRVDAAGTSPGSGLAPSSVAGPFPAPGFVTPATPASAPTASATIAASVPSPDFAASLGVQLSVFARDGVQHAELHLNPAEMGPLSIRIELDGQAARVAFAADHAATRQAIENGLPALAGALADAGFSLAGGGVSARSQGHDADDAGSDSRRGAARARRIAPAGGVELAAPIVRGITARAGGVDVYA